MLYFTVCLSPLYVCNIYDSNIGSIEVWDEIVCLFQPDGMCGKPN